MNLKEEIKSGIKAYLFILGVILFILFLGLIL